MTNKEQGSQANDVNDVLEWPKSDVWLANEESFVHLDKVMQANGYQRQEGDGIVIGGVFIGYVYAKFDPWNMADDFQIVSIIPGMEI